MNKLSLSLSFALLLTPLVAKTSPMVELFTSQGCYSCPPADEFLADMLEKQPDIVALEYHVDYWDDLRYGSAGVWKDPFSSPHYTSRQRRYNAIRLSGKRGVYTPQMVINGNTAQVGSSRRPVLESLNKRLPDVEIAASVKDNLLAVNIEGEHKNGSGIWLAIFDRVHVTEVERGENHGKTMINHHVVRELVSLGEWQGDKLSNTYELPDRAGFVGATADDINSGNRSCAVFLQDESLGQIRGATYCEAI